MSSKHLILQIFIICISISLIFGQDDDEPTICLDSGACYIGGWYDMKIRTKYARFEGIRYAQAPTGDLRFKSPQSYSDPEGIQSSFIPSRINSHKFNEIFNLWLEDFS